MRRALLGGTFDPPHIAHLVAGETAFRDLSVDVVSFLPAGAPWQKAGRVVSAPEHRWEMTRLAVGGVEYFEADPREVRRDGWTYTVDTLASYPETDELWLVLGADAALGLPTWNSHEAVAERARVAVVPRDGITRSDVEAAAGPVEWLDMPELRLSGTEIRRRALEGRSIRFLVREPVYEYILRHGLFRPEPKSEAPV